MFRFRKSIVFVIVIMLSACVQKPIITFEVLNPSSESSATPELEVMETPLPGPTLALLPALPSPTLSGSNVVAPTDFTPVMYGKKYDANTFFLLLGGVSRDVWLSPDMSVARFAGEASYTIHTLQTEAKYFFSGKAPQFSLTCQSYTIGTDIDVNEVGMVSVLDGWAITKPFTSEISPDDTFYRQVVFDWLAGEGVTSPEIDSLRIFRVDLEGDGVDEVFINATHLDGSQHTTNAGDYSIVLMRKVVGNDSVTKLVTGDVYHSQIEELTFPRTYSLVNFIDLNQDGVMEVIVDIQKWEGFGAVVYQIDDDDVIQSLKAEC